MDITEKEMNRNAVKNAVKTDITDEERLADLFGDCITDSERLKKVRDEQQRLLRQHGVGTFNGQPECSGALLANECGKAGCA